MDRLTEAELATMRAEHVPIKIDAWVWCRKCTDADVGYWSIWPCSTARLLEHFAPGPVPHLAGIAQVPDQQINHCHCGSDGMEMSHPRHGEQ